MISGRCRHESAFLTFVKGETALNRLLRALVKRTKAFLKGLMLAIFSP